MRMSVKSSKIILSIFMVVFCLALLASLFSLYPKEMADKFIVKVGLNSITSIGFLLNFVYFWLNPHLLTSSAAGVAIESPDKSSVGRAKSVSNLGAILVAVGVLYGLKNAGVL